MNEPLPPTTATPEKAPDPLDQCHDLDGHKFLYDNPTNLLLFAKNGIADTGRVVSAELANLDVGGLKQKAFKFIVLRDVQLLVTYYVNCHAKSLQNLDVALVDLAPMQFLNLGSRHVREMTTCAYTGIFNFKRGQTLALLLQQQALGDPIQIYSSTESEWRNHLSFSYPFHSPQASPASEDSSATSV